MATRSVIESRTVAGVRSAASGRVTLRSAGTALSSNGTSTKVSITSVAAQNSLVACSISFLMYQTGYGGGGFGRIFHKGGSAVGYLDVNVNSGNASLIFNADYATQDLVREINSPSFNTWHSVIITWLGTSSAAGSHIYIDGSEVGYRTSTDAIGTRGTDTTAMAIANRTTDTARAFAGYIDEVRVWNRVLTAEEIAALASAGTAPASGLVAEYLFEEGSGTTATDGTGNANGTIANGTYVTSFSGGRTTV